MRRFNFVCKKFPLSNKYPYFCDKLKVELSICQDFTSPTIIFAVLAEARPSPRVARISS